MSVERRAEGREEILREESGENGRAVVWNDDVMCVRFVNSLRGGGVAGWKESFQKRISPTNTLTYSSTAAAIDGFTNPCAASNNAVSQYNEKTVRKCT